MKKAFIFFLLFFLPTIFALVFVSHSVSFFTMYYSAFLFATIPCMLNGTRWLKLLIPFTFLSPLACYYNAVFNNYINKDLISIFAESNAGEIRGYLGDYYVLIILAYITTWLAIQAFFIFSKDTSFNFKPKIRAALLCIHLLIISTFVALDYLNNQLDNQYSDAIAKLDFEIENDQIPPNDLLRIFPINVLHQSYLWSKEKQKLNQQFQKNQNFKFKAHSNNDPKKKEIVVLVIGETSLSDHWQLQGYNRETNPQLSKLKNLVYFNNATSSTSATMFAVPQIITRKPSSQASKILFNERSILSAFKEAGFKTYWLSTQQQFGRTDTSTSIYIKEADIKRFLNPGTYRDKGRYDDVLITALNEVINDPQPVKKFVVIHTLGSHAVYEDRYPIEYEKFKPTPRMVDGFIPTSPKFKIPTVNSYDNTILYTDFVISQFIAKLDQHSDSSNMLMYLSDHGEQVFSGKCGKILHGNKTENEFKIPLITWYSDKFKKENEQKISALFQNREKPIDQTSAFPTLIDLANIEIDNYETDRSLANPLLPKYTRYIYDYLDFDKSKRVGACNELDK